MSTDFDWPIPSRSLKPDDESRFTAELLRRYEEGATIRALVELSCWTYGPIHKRLVNAGAKLRPMGRKWDAQRGDGTMTREEFTKKVVSLYCPPDPVPVHEVSARTGWSVSTIYRVLNEANAINRP
ncbi:helix-turn-helix domain-containing protein [Streptomyces albidoflavus]|uniref:helix-turn-helix domain-containing protein n=2 Tax=Streptomyces TaxID=1883 RepID=UPI003439B6CC